MSKTTVKVDGMEWNVAAVAAYAPKRTLLLHL
jgi:hypothetical protein